MKHFNSRIIPTLAFMLLAVNAYSVQSEELSAQLWARATPPGSTSAAIYGVMNNASDEPVSLEKVELTGARHVMIHRTVEEDGVMRMRHASVALEPGESVMLEPGGLHVMVMGLDQPFRQGCLASLVLHWSDKSQTIHEVNVGTFGQQAMPDTKSVSCN